MPLVNQLAFRFPRSLGDTRKVALDSSLNVFVRGEMVDDARLNLVGVSLTDELALSATSPLDLGPTNWLSH